MEETEQIISRGLKYLANQQETDGGFISHSSGSLRPFQTAKTYHTTFAPALILSALSASSSPASMAIRDKLAAWLVEQASPHWSFNYWAARSPERSSQPYPDDLDDSFCALNALYLHNPDIIDGKVLAQAVKLLLATESTVGGPYRTWLVQKSAGPDWQDVDIAVNANVAYFLSMTSEPLPNLTKFIDTAISNDALTSPYYPSAYPIVYYISRNYNGRRRQTLLRRVRGMLSKADSALELALCLSSLINLGGHARQSDIDKLIAYQLPDGSWPAAAFCLDPVINNRPQYNGAASLTTAFAVEMLERLRQPEHRKKASKPVAPYHQPAHQIPANHNEAIVHFIRSQCEHLPAELQRTLLNSIQTIARGRNGDEISSVAAYFNDSLVKPLSGASTGRSLLELGAANLYGWTAYTIYDDFLDEEGQPELLSAANTAMRYSLASWKKALLGDPAFASLADQTFDTIDAANAWELTHCRFTVMHERIVIEKLPDYGDLSKLAERSLGHSLGPIAILVRSGVRTSSRSVRQLQSAIKHYLIARQLNDDCHDWADDLRSGQITYVVSQLLSELRVQPGSRNIAVLDRRAKYHFWHITLPLLCKDMREHIRLGRAAISEVPELLPANIITSLLDSLDASIAETVKEQERSTDFLKQYASSGYTT